MFDKWNTNIDLKGLQDDVKEASNNNREFEKVPHGEYEVKVDKIELKATKATAKTPNAPMVSACFTIIEGKYKKSKIFLNQVITQGFQIHIVNELLKSMGTELNIEFVDYKQYADLLLDVAEFCDENNLEFALKYEDNKGYSKFSITDVFDVNF